MSTTSGDTNLVNTEDNTKVIETLPTLAGGYTDSTFIVNKWGYKKNRNTDNYNSFPATQILLENDERTNQDIANLRFGTKIDYLQESGTYATNIEFNLVANPTTMTINDLTYLQDFNTLSDIYRPMVLNSMEIGVGYQLVDNRDSQTYTVAKLADNNVWIVDNLNLGSITLTNDLTSQNTNLSSTITKETFNNWKKTTSAATYTTGEYISVSGSDSISQTLHGVLYNYCAASAGTICTDSNNSNATSDLCPAGWRLPTGGIYGEFQNLYNQPEYNSLAKMRNSLANGGAAFSRAGFFNAASPQDINRYGIYWASTWYDSTQMHRLYLSPSIVAPDANFGRIYGISIRCILKNPRTLSNITNMQDINPDIVANTASGVTKTLKDI